LGGPLKTKKQTNQKSKQTKKNKQTKKKQTNQKDLKQKSGEKHFICFSGGVLAPALLSAVTFFWRETKNSKKERAKKNK
jgi:hypothetical protein